MIKKIKINFKSPKRILAFTLPVLLIFAMFPLYHITQVQSNEPTNTDVMNMVGKMMHPYVTVLGAQNASTINIPLTKVGSSSTGEAVTTKTGSSFPQVIQDNNHLMLTLYEGKFANGTSVLALTSTNSGSEKLTINQMSVDGSIPGYDKTNSTINILQADVIGCTNDFAFVENVNTIYQNGTSKSHPETMKYICQNPAPVGSVTLESGQSFTAYIKGNFVAANIPISIFNGNAGYIVEGTNHLFFVRV
ncbi:MAG TPA: hypothetical protein VEU72_07645 [Nitrosopumilaceae archaeon]|nr:hypothetical protein [Nitrosopumilaceae archaeon]